VFELSAGQEKILGVIEALKYEDNGKALRRDLTKEMKRAVQPAVGEIRSGLMGMSTSGLDSAAPGLRTSVLRKLKTEVKTSGAPRVRVKIGKKGMPRKFANAPKRLNALKGWRHPVFGNREVWVHQIGEPDFFDRPLRQRRGEMRKAIMDAVEEMSRRIKRGSK